MNRWHAFLLAVVFAFAHTQCPLYFSNQNQYFLHGLAEAGFGDLKNDWLANTADPTPIFSEMVRVCVPLLIQAVYFVLLMVYFLSLLAIAQSLRTPPPLLPLAAMLIVVHSAIFRVASIQLFGVDYPWYLQCGVANQYILGPGLQPSCFGVLLLASVTAFLHDRTWLAAILIVATCAMHSTYLLAAAILTAGMLFANPARAVSTALIVLVGTLPVMVFAFGFTRMEKQYDIDPFKLIAWVRIPHHSDPNRWLDVIAALQLALIALSLCLLRCDPKLQRLIAVCALLGCAIGIPLGFTYDTLLCLAFPWRITTVLMPIATIIVIARLVPGGLVARIASVAAIALAVGGAIYVTSAGLGYRESTAERKLIEQIAAIRQPGELYLLPAGFPPPPKSRGSYSSTFLPAGTQVNPFELQRFRLGSGACAFVDFKSIPYSGQEVIEWYRRMRLAEKWYGDNDWDLWIDEIRKEGITHAIAPAASGIRSKHLETLSNDGNYIVFRIKP